MHIQWQQERKELDTVILQTHKEMFCARTMTCTDNSQKILIKAKPSS